MEGIVFGRWLHIMAGVMWIGLLYYFNFVQVAALKAAAEDGSGAGITKHAKNPTGATKLLEWLSSEKAQNLYADGNLEYPVNPKVKPDESVAAWGSFKQNLINVKQAGALQAKAVKLMDRAGYK